VPSKLPTPTIACPQIVDGQVTFPGLGAVRFWLNANPKIDSTGPLVIHWHAIGSSPDDSRLILDTTSIANITSAGGLVAAPFSSTKTGTDLGPGVWYDGDIAFVDNIVGCALAQGLPIDTRRIHTTGVDIGGVMAATVSYARSNFIASFVSNSGGLIKSHSVALQDPSHVPEALVVHGGAGKDTVGLDWTAASEVLVSDLEEKGGYVVECDHGGAHGGPADGSSWQSQFLLDHSYRRMPHPYSNGLPSTFPSYCMSQ
jgi:poly(3-hydroxybutyrate) depolymerase